MNLHKIQDLPSAGEGHAHDFILDPRSQWFEVLEREVGKRSWWQLVIQDHFSIPFTDAYGKANLVDLVFPFIVTQS